MSEPISRERLNEILDLHARWLRGEPDGQRADLQGADLRDAYLQGADLRDAYLQGAGLQGADLQGANLSDIRGAQVLGYTDHGYFVLAVEYGTDWRIFAGCRSFTLAEARAHWSGPAYHSPRSGSRCVAILDWLETQPKPQGRTER